MTRARVVCISWLLAGVAVAGLAACSGDGTGAVRVRNAWARVTGPGQTSGVVYLRVVNDTDSSFTLTGAAVPVGIAKTAELHRGRVDQTGMATMHAVREMSLPAHSTRTFRSGGDHIMLVDLARPLRAGTGFRVVLTRRGASALHATVTVRNQ